MKKYESECNIIISDEIGSGQQSRRHILTIKHLSVEFGTFLCVLEDGWDLD